MVNLISLVQKKVDAMGMYRTVTISLLILAGVSLVLGLMDILPYTFTDQILSLVAVLLAGLFSNYVFAKILKIPTNYESAVITALILFFLFIPSSSFVDHWIIALVAFIAVASKFLITWKRQHILNPVAFGAVAVGVLGVSEAVWWVGTPWLFLPLVVVGILVIMKIRKWHLVSWCVGIAFVVYLFEAWRLGENVIDSIPTFFLSWPVLFLAFFMLTEPFTTPPTKKLQIFYGAFVGGLSSVVFLAPYIIISPEIALLVGNLLFFPYTLRKKVYATLLRKREIAKDTMEFEFARPEGISFEAGQYLEWMIPHEKADNRGERRYLTIASAPYEDALRIAVRFVENSSSFKKKLKNMKEGDLIIGSQRSGDFVLPKDTSKKLAFVAGGIGVTPFISHLREMQQQNEKRDVKFFYCNERDEDIAYRDFFERLSYEGYCETIYVLSKEKQKGCGHAYLNEKIIKKRMPDYLERIWYLSGPPGMVYAYTQLLTKLGVSGQNIVRDFFSGLT